MPTLQRPVLIEPAENESRSSITISQIFGTHTVTTALKPLRKGGIQHFHI